MDMKLVGPWAVRMLLLALGGWITRAFSFGDDALWGSIADAAAGPLVIVGTAIWSWRATKAQVQAPAEPAAQVREAVSAVARAVPSAEDIAGRAAARIIQELDRRAP